MLAKLVLGKNISFFELEGVETIVSNASAPGFRNYRVTDGLPALRDQLDLADVIVDPRRGQPSLPMR